MHKFQAQIIKVGDLLFSPETGETYKKALLLTWNIIQESVKLVWLTFCLLFVIFAWIWTIFNRGADRVQTWYNNIDEPKPNNLLNATGKTLLIAGSTGAAFAVAKAKSELGIEEDIEPIKALAAQSESTFETIPVTTNQVNQNLPPEDAGNLKNN